MPNTRAPRRFMKNPVPIGETVAAWRRAHPRGGALADLRSCWGETLGGPWGRLTWPLSLRAGRLRVGVASSVVLQELSTLRARAFLARVQEAEPRVASVGFEVEDGPREA